MKKSIQNLKTEKVIPANNETVSFVTNIGTAYNISFSDEHLLIRKIGELTSAVSISPLGSNVIVLS